MDLPERDGDGYLTDMNNWTEEIGRAMAEADGIELDDAKWNHIVKAREYFEDQAVVPPIRKFSKYCGENQKEMLIRIKRPVDMRNSYRKVGFTILMRQNGSIWIKKVVSGVRFWC